MREDIGAANVVEDEGDLEVLEGLDELRVVESGLGRVCEEVANVCVGLLGDLGAQVRDDLFHLCLVSAVEDEVEAVAEELCSSCFAYSICRACDNRVWGAAVEEFVDGRRAQEIEPDEGGDAVEVGESEDT